MSFKHAAALMVAALGLVGIAPAGAAILSTTLGVGVSKENQANPPGNLSSILGASLAGSTLSFDTTTGALSATLQNVGLGVVTSFSLSLNSAVFPQATTSNTVFTFTPITCPPLNSVADCKFDEAFPANVDGFGNSGGTFDVGALADNPRPQNGLANGESAKVVWDFDLGDLDLTGVNDFFDLVDPLLVKNDTQTTCGPSGNAQCESFNAFWVAHIQVLAGGASDHIGGALGNPGILQVPEPGMLSLLGGGLLSMGLLLGLRRKQR